MDQACEIFTPVPFTAPAEVNADSTRQIPSPQELSGRKATDLLGQAQFQVVWEFTRLGGQESDDIIVATADPVAGANEFSEFMRLYCGASSHDRAQMLGRKDWCELQRILIGQAVRRPPAARMPGSSGSMYSYQPKITLSQHEASKDVMIGESAAGKKRLTWMGHSGFALARYLGSQGWTGGEAVDTFAQIHLPMGKAAIIGGVYAGKSGKRGDPAKVTAEQDALLRSFLTKFRAAKPSDDLAEDINVRQAPPKVAPTTKAIDPNIIPPARRKGSKADHEAKLAEAMTAKANQRKANKAQATAKAQLTKANNVKRK